MKLTFIRPNVGKYRAKDAMEPLVFAILKALTPSSIECELFDDRIEDIPFDTKTDLVVLSVDTFSAKRSYYIGEQFRKRNIKVIMGGYHPTFVPNEVSHYCDTVVQGDAEGCWNKIIEDFCNQHLQSRYCASENYSLKGIIPDRSIFKGKKYAPLKIIQFTRGCRFNCNFCSIHAFYGNRLIHREIEDVFIELKQLKNKLLFWADDNLFSRREVVIPLLKKITSLKLRWTCQVSIDIAKDDELLALMKKSGCVSLLIGFESLNTESLTHIGKSWNEKTIDYSTAISKIKSYGIMIHGTFILGSDGDDESTFEKTREFATKQKLFLAHFNPLIVTPATKLYDQFKKEGRLISDPWWLSDDYHYGKAVFTPQKMSPEIFEKKTFETRLKFNSLRSIFYRLLDFRDNLKSPFNAIIYLYSNFITRQEIIRKQNVSFKLISRTTR